ncbi:5'-Nucleotidase domain-containing protein [Alcanivorax sp. 521-1]|uniref:5'-Nucleotidase domain-containing protein n=1 Tax=Alloalcanivorax profundimaris TaxID=2735259 RepID=A0ABS0AQK5_9GAMM|nr:5'-nucleotidase C-terminal domain-containing protein [Alloalcanivorax profundimaris]MBF5056419.1 5'-Nucleotidase domain-containing protein [Alloalcanivorax profundimaris]
MNSHALGKLTAALLAAFALTACGGDDNNDPAPPAESTGFQLQLLHFADMDGATGALRNVRPFSAVLEALRAEHPDHTLVLSSGDNYIPGPRYFAAADDAMAAIPGIAEPGFGRADIAMLNAMGLQASAVGNHDLDSGTEVFKEILTATGNYPGPDFPYLSANLDFTPDTYLAGLVQQNGVALNSIANGLAGYGTLEVAGERIGVIGASTPSLGNITSTGDITVLPDSGGIPALAAQLQPAVDALADDGIDKIILLAHMQTISIEKELATLLEGVDIIVAGGSNTLLADDNDRLLDGDSAADGYPLSFTSAADEPVLVVNTDGDYKYVGRLVVEFDDNGVLLTDRLDDTVNGAYAADDAMAGELQGTVNSDVDAIATALEDVLAERDGNIIGHTEVFLDGRRSQVRTQETNLGNLTADANLWLARQYDANVQISIKNGGGIRDDIGYLETPPGSTSEDEVELYPPVANEEVGKQEGDISQFDIEGSLRFNNSLTIGDVTAGELVQLLEHGVSGVENTEGRFPQVAGLRFSFEPTAPARQTDGTTVTQASERVRNLAVVDDSGAIIDTVVQNGVLQGDANRVFRLVTLGYLATENAESGLGGDGYPFDFPVENRLDLEEEAVNGPDQATFAAPGTEQDALAEYLIAHFDAASPYAEAETDTDQDGRIQNLADRADTVLP